MADEGAGSATVREEAEAGVHGDGALAAPVPAEAPKKRRRARSASCPRTSQDRRNKMGAFDRNGWWIEFHDETSDPLLG